MKEGKLCITNSKKLYIGLKRNSSEELSSVVEYENPGNGIVSKFKVDFSIPSNVTNKDSIYLNILKPFSDPKNPPQLTRSIHWFNCTKDFVSFETLFMFILKNKYDKDYSLFMDLCKQNLQNIRWDIKDEDGNTMLHYVAVMTQYHVVACDIIQYIKSSDKYNNLINKTNSKGVVPLAFVLFGNIGIKQTLLHARIVAHSSILNELINAKANILLKSHESDSYVWKGGDEIHFCTLQSDPTTILVATRIIDILKQSEAILCCRLKEPPGCELIDVNSLNKLDNIIKPNLLEQIMHFPCIQIIKSLFSKKLCKFDTQMTGGTIVLHYVVQFCSKELIKFVIEKIPTPHVGIPIKDRKNNTILHLSILRGDENIVQAIIESCPSSILNEMLETQNASNETPLDLILHKNMLNLMVLLQKKIPTLIQRKDNENNTWFHKAIENKNTELLKYLAAQQQMKDIVNNANRKGDTPLMQCVNNRYVEGLRIILGIHESNSILSDARGFSLLHLAIINYETDTFLEVLQDAVTTTLASTNIINESIKVPIHNDTASNEYRGLTPLLLSMKCEQFTAAQLLIANGASIDALDAEGNSLSYYLIKYCHVENVLIEFFKIQLKANNFINKNESHETILAYDKSLLYLCVKHLNISAFRLLLPRSNINMLGYQDMSLDTVLHLVLSDKKYTVYLELLIARLVKANSEMGGIKNVINKKNLKEDTPLLLSVYLGDSEIVKQLINLGCDIPIIYSHLNSNILHLAALYGDNHMMVHIISVVKEEQLQKMTSCRNTNEQTPLHIAMHRNQLRTVEILLELKTDLRKQDTKTTTLLNYAIEHENIFEVVYEKIKLDKELLCSSVEVLRPSHCVIHAISHKNILALRALINYNSKFINLEHTDLPLLHFAISMQFDKGVEFLLSLGVSLATRKPDNSLTLHSDRLKLNIVLSDTKVGYKLANGYVMTDIPKLSTNQYQKPTPVVKKIEILMQNLVSCETIEPLQSYLIAQLHPIDMTQLSLISSQYATFQVMSYLLSGECPNFSFDWKSKGNSENTVVHCGVYNPCIEAFNRLLECLTEYENSSNLIIKTYTSLVGNKLVNSRNANHYSALELAMSVDNSNSFDVLIRNGASLDTKDHGQNNIIHKFLLFNNANISYLDRILSKSSKEHINEYNSTHHTPLHTAIVRGNIPAYCKLSAIHSCKYDAVTKDQFGDNIVHLAIKNGNTDLLKQVIKTIDAHDKGKGGTTQLLKAQNKEGLSPLFLAVELGDTKSLLTISECGIEGSDKNGGSILHYAIEHCHNPQKQLEMIKTIVLKQKDFLNSKDNSNETPLHYAIKTDIESILSLLLTYTELNLCCQNNSGMTALHFAVKKKFSIFENLLKVIEQRDQLDSILNVKDSESKTALHHCIDLSVNNSKILDTLLVRKPDTTIVDVNSNSVLHSAAMNEARFHILEALLKHINLNCPGDLPSLLSVQNNENNTPLYCAIQAKNISGIEEFLKVNASLQVIQNNRTVTLCNSQPSPHTTVPMQLFSVKIPDKPKLEICVGFKVLTNRWILSDLPTLSCTYLTPVISTTSKTHNVSDLKITESILITHLLKCVCYEPLQLVISVVIKQCYTNSAKLMHLAASFGSLQVVQYLIEYYGTNLQYLEEDNRGYSVLHYSVENRNADVLREMLTDMKTHHPQKFTELSGKLLDFCIKNDCLKSFKILLERQYDTNADYKDENGDSLLHLIVLHRRIEDYTRELLVCSQLISSEYCNLTNKNGNTALHLAIEKNQLNNVIEILKHKPDMSVINSAQNMALHIAVEQSNIDIIIEVIEHINQLPNKLKLINASNAKPEKNKPIHLATLRGDWKIVELLLINGADLYSLNASDSTILHLAVQLEPMKGIQMTRSILQYEPLNRSGNMPFILLRDNLGCTPLHLAVKCKCVDCINLLMKEQVDLSLLDVKGETVLHFAIKTQNDTVFDLIYQSFLNLPNQCCVVTAQVRRLFCFQNTAGISPLHLSIELQYNHAVTRLLSQSVCVDTRDVQGQTVLHYAAMFQKDRLEVLTQVIDSTASISIKSTENTSQTSCMLNSIDVSGRTPLLLAIENSKQQSVVTLLECKPDFLIRDHKGNGAIAYAVMNLDSFEILSKLLSVIRIHFPNDGEYIALINKQNKLGLSALHVAIYSDNFDGAQRLVAEGAKLAIKDPSNSICTVGMHGLWSKRISLKIGSRSTPGQNDENMIGYTFHSTANVIYSSLPDLDNVYTLPNKIDFEESVSTTAIVCDILRSTCPEILEAIFRNKPNYMNQEFEHIPLFHLAAEFATLPIMQFLCEDKFQFKFEEKDSTDLEETVIHHSVLNPCSEVVDCLLDKVEQYERENGITINIIDLTDNVDCSPLKKSTNIKEWENFMILIKHGADFTKKDSNGTILHAIISKNDESSFKSLECLINAINQSKLSSVRKQRMFDITHNGLTAIHLAVSLSNTTAALQLINAGVDLTNINKGNGYTIVHTYVNRPECSANLLLLSVLCKAVAKHDFTQIQKYKVLHMKDQKGDTSLHHTIKGKNNAKMLETLLNNNAPFTVGDLHGNAALHLAAKNNLLSHVKTILFFIQNDARDRGYGPHSRKERCIQEIMRKNNKKELPILLTKDKDILLCMLKFWDNQTLLNLDLYRSGYLIHFAVFNQDRELVEAILVSQSGTQKFEMLRSRDSENNSPLHIAAEKDDTVIGKLLIDHGVDVNVQSVRGTPIEVAIKCEGVDFATKLINEGADIKRFVFLLANDLISEKRITLILDDGQMSINAIYSSCDCSVIHYAARISSSKRISFLLRKNADLCAKDRDGRGAVHHAISTRRDMSIIQTFLDEAYRLDINDADTPNLNSLLDFDYFGQTPGMLSADLNNLNFFKVICTEKYKFYLDTFHYTDCQGNNVLHHLIRSNAMECIRFLIPYLESNFQEGFSQIMNGRNHLGLSPMGLARRIGQQETVNLIVQTCDSEFFQCCPDVVHKIVDEEDNKTLSNILDKMVLCDANNAFISTKIMDSNDEGGYPNFRIFNYHLAPLWHKMYGSQTNRIKYHPLLKFTVDAKIKLYQWWYLLMLFLYFLLFYIPMVTALLMASFQCDDLLFYYYSHWDIFRFFLEIYIITVSILYIVNEAIEVFGKWKYLKNLPRTSRVLAYVPPDQISYYGLEKLEGLVFTKVVKLLIDAPHIIKYKLHLFDRKRTNYLLRTTFQHISISYSLLEIISVILLMLLFLFRIIIFITTVPFVRATHWTLSSLTFIAFTFKFFKYTKIFPTLGIYIETIFQVLKKDVPRFMVVILIILVGYAGGAHLIARRFDESLNNRRLQASDECSPSSWLGEDFDSVYSIMTPILSGLLFLVGGGPADYELEFYHIHIIFSIFYFTFAFGIIVVLSNIFIAQLSQTYSDILSEKHLIDYKADLALQYEKQTNLAFIFEWFFSKAFRRIMVESLTVSLSEWNSYLKFYSERINSDSNVKFRDLLQSEDTAGTNPETDSDDENTNANFSTTNLVLKKREEAMDAHLSKLQLLITQIQHNNQTGDSQPQVQEKTKEN